MKSRRRSKNKDCSVGNEPAVTYRVYSECGISSCEICGIYRQMTGKPSVSYCALLKKTLSENNIALFKNVIIIAISFLASLINFSRLANFKEEQIYLETVLSALLYYLATSSWTRAATLLLGGLFHWYLAFETKSKNLTLIVMTCIQVAVESLRHYEWFTMVEHIFMSCVAIHMIEVFQTYYVTIMIYCVASAYCFYVVKLGIGLGDLLFSSIIVFANHYVTTGDPKHCYLKDNMIALVIWIVLREIRGAVGYTGLGAQLF